MMDNYIYNDRPDHHKNILIRLGDNLWDWMYEFFYHSTYPLFSIVHAMLIGISHSWKDTKEL